MHGFSWTAAKGMVDLGTLGGNFTFVRAVNARGQVVGHSYLSLSGQSHAFVWTETDGIMDLGTLGGLTSEANAINDRGQIVGVSATPDGSPHATLWEVVIASPPEGYYEIVSRNSDKCLDVSYASTEAAASVIQWTCHGGENQQWRLESVSDGVFRIIARHSGQVLDVYRGLVDDVIPTIQYPWHGGDNQQWTLEPASNGYVFIVARHSGKVLDVEGGSVHDGARVIQYTRHGGANQQWLLHAVAPAADPTSTVSDDDLLYRLDVIRIHVPPL
jgi:probable HAF family extracellular repeat protein